MKKSAIVRLVSVFISIFSLSQFILWGVDWLRNGFSWGSVPYIWIVLHLLARTLMSNKKHNFVANVSNAIFLILLCFGIAGIIEKNWFITGLFVGIPVLVLVIGIVCKVIKEKKEDKEYENSDWKKDKNSKEYIELTQSLEKIKKYSRGFGYF